MADNRYDHRKPGGRLEGFVDETPGEDHKDKPFISAELLAYMERRYEAVKEELAAYSGYDPHLVLSVQGGVFQMRADLAHYKALAADQKNQSTERSSS